MCTYSKGLLIGRLITVRFLHATGTAAVTIMITSLQPEYLGSSRLDEYLPSLLYRTLTVSYVSCWYRAQLTCR